MILLKKLKVKRALKMIREILIFFIKSYRLLISPYLGQNCRFYPTCSEYSIQALKTYGLLIGLKYIIIRIAKCNPWGGSGVDLLPEKKNVKN